MEAKKGMAKESINRLIIKLLKVSRIRLFKNHKLVTLCEAKMLNIK